MRTHQYLERFNTGDGSEHGDWVIGWFDYTKTQRTPSVVERYTNRLRHIPVKELEVVCQDLQNTDYAKPILPGVEAILSAHARRKKRQQERITEAKSLRKKATEGEREAAKKATNAAFANRIMEHIGFKVPLHEPRYAGDFDYLAVANAAPLPDVKDHKHDFYWNECWRIFNEQWAEYAG